jgi:Ca-activated chloride channel homolog
VAANGNEATQLTVLWTLRVQMRRMAHYAEWLTMSSGRHRGPGLLSTGTRAIFVVVVLVAGVGALVLWQSVGGGGASGCSGEVRLSVAAAPEIAPAIQQTANGWATGARAPGGQCVAVDVTPVNAAEIASAIAANGGVTLTGLTAASPAPTPAAQGAVTVAVPDVWVADSSTWLVRVRAAGPNLVPPQAPSIARSPVVLAMPEPVAATLGWPNAPITWSTLLQRMTSGQPLKVGIVEPNRDAVGLAGLVALGNAAASAGAAAEQATIAAMRALVAGRTSAYSDLMTHFPKSAEPAALAAALMAAPMSEHSLIAYNQTSPAVKLAGFYIEPAPPALDYPYAVMPGISADKSGLAEDLRNALAGDSFQDHLAAAGLRDHDGAGAGRSFPILPGAPASVPGGQLDGVTVAKALTTWISVTRPARMLAVIDISGSMALPVPSAGGASRGQVSVAAAQQGMALFDDSWAVGLWTFSTNLDGANDYRQLLPIGKMSEQRSQLQAALASVAPIPNGQTGLYDTVLAAYKTVQAGWDPSSVNSVVLLTDGQNQDPSGITLDELVEQLKSTMDVRRPIQVIAIGIGDEVSEAELTRITSTTGGGTFIARDPSAIGPIFIKALSLRPPVPTT